MRTGRSMTTLVLALSVLLPASLSAGAPHAVVDAAPVVSIDPEVETLERRMIRVVAESSDALVRLRTGGCGVIISPEGLVLTAAHCVPRRGRTTVLLEDGRSFTATSLGKEDLQDFAMLRIEGCEDPLPYVPMGRSATLQEGQVVLNLAYPGPPPAGHAGVPILRLGRIVDPLVASRENGQWVGMIRTTAAMEPGDSGGPLLDLDGRVIGINSRIEVALDRNYHVPVDAVLANWKTLIDGAGAFSAANTSIERIGLTLDDELPDRLNRGAHIAELDPDGLAEEAGLLPGDVVTGINGRSIRSPEDLESRLRRSINRHQGHPMRLRIDRAGEHVEVDLSMIERGDRASDAEAFASAKGAVETHFADATRNAAASVVRVRSSVDGVSKGVLGLVVGEGLVVSKGTRVGASPRVVIEGGLSIDAEVAAEDMAHDLVLLVVDGLDAPPAEFEPGDLEVGSLLASVRGPNDEPVSGVLATDEFKSRARLLIGIQFRNGTSMTVEDLMDGFPAQAAGIEAGDRIVAMDGRPTPDRDSLRRFMRTVEIGQTIRINTERDGLELSFSLTPQFEQRERSGGHAADRVPGGVSARATGFERVFGHDCILRPEEVGGPVVDTHGRVIGLNIARSTRTHALAVPAEVVLGFIRDALPTLEQVGTAP